ncbi:mediator complex subunit 13 C-terminal-domain-containing protein [Aspergillus floccosus]
MDFPGGSITNIRAIDGFSTIYYRIYTDEQTIPSVPGDASSNAQAILRHLSRLKDLELRLRNLDCLVSSIPRRLGLWVFSATPDFENLTPLCLNNGKDEQNRIALGSSTLKVSASGSVPAADLVRTLSSESPNTGGNQSGSQRPPNAATPTRRTDNYSSLALIYALFISAVTSALNLQLIRRNNAIPLGPRTLYTVVEKDSNNSPGVIIGDASMVPCLATLQVQLTVIGKLTVSLQTISQPGLMRLRQPGDNLTEVTALPPGTDLWLCPSGTIARLISTNPNTTNSSSPHPGAPPMKNDIMNMDPNQWKANVLDWLKNFGLTIDSDDDISWVMVEVWEPFYSRLAGETWRPSDSSSTIPLKRILWPDIYCFRRKKSTNSDDIKWMKQDVSDPLDFVQSWHGKPLPKLELASPGTPSNQQATSDPPKDRDASSLPEDVPEGLESLSRASQYPELQTASLVYPTPPDGATGLGLNATATSDTFADDSDFGSGALHHNGKTKSFEHSGSVPMEFGPSAGLTVGSGLYDTNDDDDLFGDMNERDFGTKGITDADFSFFDDPGFDNLGEDVPDSAQALSDIMELAEPNTEPAIVEEIPPEVPVTEEPPVPEPDISHVDLTDNPTGSRLGDTPVHDSAIHKQQSPAEQNQTISPPLSPVEIKRILFPGTNGNVQPSIRKGKSQSYYNPIAFKEDISTWDQKYGAAGKFGFTIQEPKPSRDPSTFNGDIPTVGLPGRGRKIPTVDGVVLDAHESNDAGQQNEPVSDSGSDSSDDGENSLSDGDVPETVISSLKRKRARSNSGNSLALSQAKSTNEGDKGTPAPKVDHSIFLGNFLSTSSDWSMAGYFSFQENQIFPVLARKDSQVQIAQLLVDQVTQSSLDHKLDGTCSISDLESETYSIQTFLDGCSFMSGIERLDLNGFVSLQDSDSAPSPAANGVSSRQPTQRKDTLKGSLTKLSPPHLRVRRGKEYLEALPPTVLFWETFGLEPAHGPKDVSAYCIHPRIASNAADAFLDRLGSVYSSCNLGSHTRGDRYDAFNRGLGVWDIASDDIADYSSVMQSLTSICANLGSAFLKSPPSKDNLVIYIVNPFSHAAALVDICSAFWSLFQTYVAAADKQQTPQLDELVLQIVPVDFIMSTDSFVVPPQTQYLNLALEIYSRCPPKDQQASLVNCAPPVLITEPLPKSINFRLASEKTSPLQEGKCLHIASSRSQDQRWISVAWSDNTGSLQRTMSYNVRFRNSTASRTLQDVRGEIWGATKDIMERIQARWRIVLVNSDPVDQDEVDSWTKFVEQYNMANATPVELTMLNVSATPDLYLDPPPLPIPMSVFNLQSSSTPIATPNPNALSPDQTGNASTPPSGGYGVANAPTPTDSALEAESESLLTDVTDETWAVTLSHRLNSSPHLMDYRPALASGYLLRRKGATDGDGVYTLTLNLIYTQRHTSSYETVLREILQLYRDLATLARARGTRTVQRSAMPWHIATAVRAQEALSYVM